MAVRVAMMNLLLDTCALLWLAVDQAQLSSTARQAIAKSAGRLAISAMTPFELGLKQKAKKIEFATDVWRWYQLTLDLHGLNEIPVTGEIAYTSTQLPRKHRDPIDRILIATAKVHGLSLLTPDAMMGQYPGINVVW